jgi:hypothetical protein
MKFPTALPLKEREDSQKLGGEDREGEQLQPLPQPLPHRGLVSSDIRMNTNPG